MEKVAEEVALIKNLSIVGKPSRKNPNAKADRQRMAAQRMWQNEFESHMKAFEQKSGTFFSEFFHGEKRKKLALIEASWYGYKLISNVEIPGKVLAMPKSGLDRPWLLFDLSCEHPKFKGFQIEFPGNRSQIVETHAVFLHRAILLADSYCDDHKLRMIVTRITGDQVRSQVELPDWQAMKDYTLACSSQFLAFVGGENLQQFPSSTNIVQFMRVLELESSRLS